MITDERVDLMCIVKIWLDMEGGVFLEMGLPEFLVCQPRSQNRGGGEELWLSKILWGLSGVLV